MGEANKKKRRHEYVMRVRFQHLQDMLEISEKMRFWGYDVSVTGYDYTIFDESEVSENELDR